MCQKNDLIEFSFAEKNKSEEEQRGAYIFSRETVKVTSTINEAIDCIVTYIHNDSVVQQRRKAMRISSLIFKTLNNEEKVYIRTKYENGMDYKFDYKYIDHYDDVTYIQNVSEVQQSRKAIRISLIYNFKRQNNEEKVYSVVVNTGTKYENGMDYKFDHKDVDYGDVIAIVDIKDISDYSSVIMTGKINISTSPVDIQNDEKEFKKLEAEIGDDTYRITVTFKEDQVKKVKNQLTYIINIQSTKSLSLNSHSKTVNALQIANVVESPFEDNLSSATVEVTSICGVVDVNRFFLCKRCSEKVKPCQKKLQQCTECGMKQFINDNKDTNISVILFLSEPELLLTIFQDQLDNIIKIYNEENNENIRLATLTDTTLTEIVLSVSDVKIHYDKNTQIIRYIQKK